MPAGSHIRQLGARWAGWYGIGVMVLITLFGFVDRQVFILLAESIKQDLQLTDLQLGMLQGLGVALFGALAGYPIGWLADRYDRRVVLGGCLLIWSLAVVGCGLAPDFGLLFLASALVGAGEAGLTPIVYSLIPDLVKERQRQLANSIYTVATQLGIGLATALCAAVIAGVAAWHSRFPETLSNVAQWRLVFFAVAIPAPIFLLLLATVGGRDRSEGVVTPARAAPASNDAAPMTAHLRDNWQTMLGFYFGIGLAAFGFASIMNWVPVITMRMHGISAATAASATGIATIVATGAGFVIGTAMLRLMQPRYGQRTPIVALWTATLSAAVTSFALLFTSTAMQIFVLQGVQYALIIGAFMVFPTAIQDISPPQLRARSIALMGIVRLVLLAGSPLVVGAVSDKLKSRSDGLLMAAAGSATVSLGVGALLLWWCGRHYLATVRSSAEESAHAY